jgi:predicted enzyme related to lactoylglutathione lyase
MVKNKLIIMDKIKLRGLSTVSFYADDHEKAIKWYAEILGMEPYFSVHGYSEFRLGDFQHELGIIDGKYAPKDSAKEVGGAIAYWHVDDLQKTLDLLISKGAKLYEPIIDRSGGKMAFVTASVIDPFGNVLGIMTNEHYLEILNKKNVE